MPRSECKAVPGCGWTAEAPVKDIVGCAATWHVYEEHPEVWQKVAGDRPPVDPDPRTDEGMQVIVAWNLSAMVNWALSEMEAGYG